MAQSYKNDTYKRHVYWLRPAPRLVVSAEVDLVPDVVPEADADEAVLGAVADADLGPDLGGGAVLDDTSPVIAPDVQLDDGPSLGGAAVIEHGPALGGGGIQLEPSPALRGVVEAPVSAKLGGTVSISSVPQVPVPQLELTWIELVAVLEDGRPAGSQAYAIRLPEGTVRFGRLRSDGKARIEGLLPGSYGISFPGLDHEAWEPVVAPSRTAEAGAGATSLSAADVAPVARSWVEIGLLTEDGSPAAGHRYIVREADGTEHPGTLDGDGRARVEDILAADCAVSFPDLDGDNWEPAPPSSTSGG